MSKQRKPMKAKPPVKPVAASVPRAALPAYGAPRMPAPMGLPPGMRSGGRVKGKRPC
jgi:hypothetical protein